MVAARPGGGGPNTAQHLTASCVLRPQGEVELFVNVVDPCEPCSRLHPAGCAHRCCALPALI